jgi:hypothetical protein
MTPVSSAAAAFPEKVELRTFFSYLPVFAEYDLMLERTDFCEL